MDQTSRRAIAFGLLAAAIWGGMYVVSKAVLAFIPPFALLSLRLLLGAAALGAVLWRTGRWPRLSRSLWAAILLVGELGYGLSLGLQFAGTRLSTAANGAVITTATPAFVYLFAYFILGERVGAKRLAALLLATLGVLLVVDPVNARLDADLWRGNLILVGAALTWALYSVLVRRGAGGVGALPFTFVALLGGLPVALPVGAWELSQVGLPPLSLPLWLGVLYLGLVSTALAAYLWNYAFEHLEAGLAGLTFFAQPLVGAALGALLLGEQLSAVFILGGVLILLGLWLAAGRNDKITQPS